jgi:hypothetical protein
LLAFIPNAGELERLPVGLLLMTRLEEEEI